MSRKLVVLLLIIIILTTLSGLYVVGGTRAYSRYQLDHPSNQEYCGGETPVHICVRTPTELFSAFYPAYLAEQSPLFSVSYTSTTPMTLVVNLSITRFSQVQTQTVTATSSAQVSMFIPPLLDQALRKLTTEENTSLHVQVSSTKGHLFYVTDIPLLLHSRWLMNWTKANRLRIAAWITPNDPAVATLVAKAATHLQDEPPPVPKAMVGYATATPQQVIAQVDAIYDALRLDYHIQYVQETVPYNAASDAGTAVNQYIKLPAEVLQQRSGMCVELTALMASAVERIGLNAKIVITPGHAFLGVAVSKDGKEFHYWDAVNINNGVAADTANVATDNLFIENMRKNSIVDTILVSEARNAQIGPML